MWLEHELLGRARPARAHASPRVRSLFLAVYNTLRDMRKRQLAHQVLNLAMIVCSALMIWKSLMVVTSSESPVVVVLSGSMEPAFHRGDILFLHMGFTPFRAGDIVVFKVADRDIPIVHRVIKVHEKESGEVDLLTKGDNNAVDDRGLYAASQSWINKEHVIGRAKGYLPYVSARAARVGCRRALVCLARRLRRHRLPPLPLLLLRALSAMHTYRAPAAPRASGRLGW